MSSSSDHVLAAMKAMTKSIKDREKTPKEAELEFLQQVSKQQLEYCLTDQSLDDEDVSTIKEMLKYFFNYEPDIN